MASKTITLVRQHGQATVQWQATKSTASKRFIGVCPPMNLSIEADSLDELYSLIPETIHILMRDLLEDNEIQPFLREIGWQFPGELPKPSEDVRIHVPWELVVSGEMGDTARHRSQRA
jgi:hypothetical protein